jgi:hypothetical protein
MSITDLSCTTFSDDPDKPSPQREQFHRNLRAVELVLGGATQTSVPAKEGIPRSTLGRLVRRTSGSWVA